MNIVVQLSKKDFQNPFIHPPENANAIQLDSFQPLGVYLGDSTLSNTGFPRKLRQTLRGSRMP